MTIFNYMHKKMIIIYSWWTEALHLTNIFMFHFCYFPPSFCFSTNTMYEKERCVEMLFNCKDIGKHRKIRKKGIAIRQEVHCNLYIYASVCKCILYIFVYDKCICICTFSCTMFIYGLIVRWATATKYQQSYLIILNNYLI